MKKDDEILKEARKRFSDSETFESENRDVAREDLEFLAGDQWDEEAKTAREGRAMLTINRMPQFVKQVTGDIRISRRSIKVRPKGYGASKDVAKIYQGLIRSIENECDAVDEYATAADLQVGCGEGALRVYTEWSDDETFEQDIKIEAVKNIFSTHFDPHAKKKTKEDAEWGIVTERISEKEFKRRYPKAKVSSYQGSDEDVYSWFSNDSVRIAEYFYKESERRILALLEGGQVFDITDIKEPVPGVVRTRTVDIKKVYRCVLSGLEVLEKPKEFPSKHIPLIRVCGEEIHLGDRVERYGLIRFAKDSQKAHNYTRSAEVETVALQPKIPWVVYTKAIKGFERYWNQANTSNLAYLPYDFEQHPGGPQRQPPPAFSQGWAALSTENADDMKATTGVYDSAMGARSNETSGRAIAMREGQTDTSTFIYPSNLRASIRAIGKILVDMIPRVYDSQRMVNIINEDDSEEEIEINMPLPDGTVKNDITAGKYSVVVSTGPSYATQRMEAADSMLQATQANPALWQIVGDLIAKNWDWPGADEIAERLKRTIPAELLEGQEDDPTAPYKQMIQQLQQQIQQIQQQPDFVEKMAKAQKTQAETEGQLLENETTELENAEKQLELSDKLGQLEAIVQNAVRQALVNTLS